jgi:beta-phosphoglucomutase-like phosphatase (HAD superfamily)
VSASEVAEAKPSGEIFWRVAKKLEVSAANCAVIEETRGGIKAARRAGMSVVGYVGPGSAGHDLSEADLMVYDLGMLTSDRLHSHSIGRAPLPERG